MRARYGAPLIAGKAVYGNPGLGVTGAVIRATTATGDFGPGLLYNDWDSSADDAKEFRALIVTPPSAGAFWAFEDGSFALYSAPDGTYSISYRLFVDGVDMGLAPPTTITVGSGATTGSITGAGGIASSEAVGVPALTRVAVVPGVNAPVTGAGGIASAEAVGQPSLTSSGQPGRWVGITPAARRLIISAELMASNGMQLPSPMSPGATLDYQFDWGAWVPEADSITSYSIAVGPGLVLEAQGREDAVATVWITLDDATPSGEQTSILCAVQTASGRIDSRAIPLLARQR